MKLGHVHLKVRELNRAVEFYSELLGLRIFDQLDQKSRPLTRAQLGL